MRNIALLLAATVVAVACADQNPSAPSRSSSGVASADNVANQPTQSASAKPIDQVGFTKISRVDNVGTIGFGQDVTISVACPAGTVNTGGGYKNHTGIDVAHPVVVLASYFDVLSNKWTVRIINPSPDVNVDFIAFAYCAS